MTHTPGPWILNIEDGRAEVCVDGERLTDPYIGDEDARLIAAAPELLEALRDCLGSFVDVFPASAEYGPIKRGFAAIAKAEGRS